MLLQLFSMLFPLWCGLVCPTAQVITKDDTNNIASLFKIMKELTEFRQEMRDDVRTMKVEINIIKGNMDNLRARMDNGISDLKKKITTESNIIKSNMDNLRAGIQGTIKDETITLKKKITKANNDSTCQIINEIEKNSGVVFYPFGTKDHVAKRYYGEYGLAFKGYGTQNSYDDAVVKYVDSLESCLSWCYSVRLAKGESWDDLYYQVSAKYCACFQRGVGHHVHHDFLHYHFV